MDSTVDQVVQNAVTLVSTWGCKSPELSRFSFSVVSRVEPHARPCDEAWKAEG
jgi:hypothetical protein